MYLENCYWCPTDLATMFSGELLVNCCVFVKPIIFYLKVPLKQSFTFPVSNYKFLCLQRLCSDGVNSTTLNKMVGIYIKS